MTLHERMEDLVALYALDALEGDERSSFEAHLEGCSDCQLSLGEYQAITSGLVPDEPASEATWQRISDSIDAEPEASVTHLHTRSKAPAGWKWLAGIAAAAAVSLAGILAVQLMGAGQLTDESIVAAAEEVAAESNSINADFLVDDVAVASVVLSSDGRGFVLPEDSLVPLDPDRTYQLWVINGEGDVISAGVLGAAPTAAAFTWTGEVSGFALTREVAGGVVSSAGDVVSVIQDV